MDQKVTLWRVGPVVKHGALTGRPGRRHALSTWTSHAPTYTCEHGPKTQNHVLRPWTWTMPLLKHAPPPQSNVAETWSWKPYGRHHAPCTWPHPHTRYDDTQQVLTTTHSPGCCPRSHRTFRCMIPKLQMRAKTMLLVDIHLTSRGTWTPKPSHNPLFSFQSRNWEMYYVWSHQQLLFRFLSFFCEWYQFIQLHLVHSLIMFNM